MAGEPVDEPMLDHPCGAVRALDAVAAGAAQGQRREAAAVEEQQALLALAEPVGERVDQRRRQPRSEEHTSELQSLMRNSYAVFCLKKKTTNKNNEKEP